MGCTLYTEEHLVHFYMNISLYDFEESLFLGLKKLSQLFLRLPLLFLSHKNCHPKQ
jgi:hypothetical protein